MVNDIGIWPGWVQEVANFVKIEIKVVMHEVPANV